MTAVRRMSATSISSELRYDFRGHPERELQSGYEDLNRPLPVTAYSLAHVSDKLAAREQMRRPEVG